ncbi:MULTISPECIES: hypothetical protein [unclassified Streptomyces]|uniref:hypothetical protein n=1 Tax=unclassified Streptomyces TaxID=2593676 RepID=UPI0036E663BA
MAYVHLGVQVGELSGVLDPSRYLERLPSISGDLPSGARSFAMETGHYDFHSRRCVKDLTLRAVRGLGGEEIEVEFQHNCWKHDRDLAICYVGVSSFVIDPAGEDRGTDLEILVDVFDLDAVTRVRTHGSAGINRPWAQLARYGDRIALPAYGGTFRPTPHV